MELRAEVDELREQLAALEVSAEIQRTLEEDIRLLRERSEARIAESENRVATLKAELAELQRNVGFYEENSEKVIAHIQSEMKKAEAEKERASKRFEELKPLMVPMLPEGSFENRAAALVEQAKENDAKIKALQAEVERLKKGVR